jgi:hypothetical protein
VRDAVLTDDDKLIVSKTDNRSYQAYTEGPVTDLQNALVWVDHHGEGGGTWGTNNVPAGYASGTTEGYSEYRLFLKKDQRIEHIVLSLLKQMGDLTGDWMNGYQMTEKDTRDCISIQLYGAGVPGAEKKITRVATPIQGQEDVRTLNYSNDTIGPKGLISLYRNAVASVSGYQNKYKALVLGKNITIWGGGGANDLVIGPTNTGYGDNPWGMMGVGNFLNIGANSTVIMEEHSKITGYYTQLMNTNTPVLITDATARFYVKGGIITGNVSNTAGGNPVSVSSTKITLSNVFSNQGGTVNNMTKAN